MLNSETNGGWALQADCTMHTSPLAQLAGSYARHLKLSVGLFGWGVPESWHAHLTSWTFQQRAAQYSPVEMRG
jgi:hypothetical protein